MKSLKDSLRRLASFGSEHRRRKRRKQSLILLAGSELFDRSWYLQAYPDVRASGVDPIRHYFESGWREGRDPGPDFCTTAYLKGNCDVASLGINPLLHYIQHGRFEGRGAPHQGAPFRASFSPEERFGPAAPCPTFDLPTFEAVKWTRAGRLTADGLDASVGGLTVARFDDEEQRRSFKMALEQLAWLSGHRNATEYDMRVAAGVGAQLRDAWHTGSGVLRTRWSPASDPIVVRAIQHAGEQALLIGEGCIAQQFEFVDVKPANPFYPLLFVFTATDGGFLGFRQLTFPALCRGGLYYPELVASSRDRGAPVDLTAFDEQLAAKLTAIRAGGPRTVGQIAVTLQGADGTHPLFQTQYKQWLANVVQVNMSAADRASGAAQDHLVSALRIAVGSARGEIATLRIASDMIPALSALLMSKVGDATDELPGSTIVVSHDANIATLVRVPVGMSTGALGSAVVPTLSRADWNQASNHGPLLAIRLSPRRPADDAELLVPNPSIPDARAPGETSITWLLWPDQWRERELLQSLEALAQQVTGLPEVIFVGQGLKTDTALTEQLFGIRVRIASTAAKASEMIDTSLTGYLGPGIILHDRRTVLLLTAAMEEPDIVTATALVVSAEKRGKGSLVVPADGRATAVARFLPLTVVPIAEPPDEFWIGRTEVVRDWIGQPEAEQAGRHVCSTHCAVSRFSPFSRTPTKPPIATPPSSEHTAISTEALIG